MAETVNQHAHFNDTLKALAKLRANAVSDRTGSVALGPRIKSRLTDSRVG